MVREFENIARQLDEAGKKNAAYRTRIFYRKLKMDGLIDETIVLPFKHSSGFTFEVDKGIIKLDDKEVLLSNYENQLFEMLVNNIGKITSHEDAMSTIWDEYSNEATIRVHIQRIRKKLGQIGVDPSIIESVRSKGYYLRDNTVKS